MSFKLVIVSIGTCLKDSIFLLAEEESPDVVAPLESFSMPLDVEFIESIEGEVGDVVVSASAPSTTSALSSGVLHACKEKVIAAINANFEIIFFILFYLYQDKI